MALPQQARTVDALLEAKGESLQALLDKRHTEGLSYRGIARQLFTLTGGVVDVTPETIRNWINSLDGVAS
jgi:hypothetical protein